MSATSADQMRQLSEELIDRITTLRRDRMAAACDGLALAVGGDRR